VAPLAEGQLHRAILAPGAVAATARWQTSDVTSLETPDERWDAALDAVGAVAGDREAAFADLVARHREPGRHHHVLAHASGVVDAVLAVHGNGDDWATTVLAAWYHDVVYDPRASTGANEGASAVLARRALQSMGASLTATGEVCRLICLTADHDPGPGDRNGGLLCDADLAVLASDEDSYVAYAAAVRQEYAHVGDDAWRTGRRAVLRSFLDRPQIFRTIVGRERWESRARINISSELASLG
jgi:predicted metal-dependent HD superfamily phosphohydrolase